MEKSSHIHGSKDLILFRWNYSLNGFTDSMQHLTKSQLPNFFNRHCQADSKTHMEMQ